MITNADITLYSYDKGTQGYIRKEIEDVFWSDTKQANMLKSGMQNVDSVLILIPPDCVADSDITFTAGKDLIVKGICDFEFDNTDQKSIAASLKLLNGVSRVVTLSSVDEKLYGGAAVQHYKLGCK